MPRKIYTRDQAWKQLRVIFLLLGMAGGASLALAQLPTATILGVVKDATGAVMPDATLTARNVETGQSRSAVSGGDGSYRFSALPVGSYEIRVGQAGFQTAVRSGLTLTVGQEAVVNFTLEVGAVTQTVAVTAEAPLVNTTSGSLGGLVGEESVADLPLNGRNYIDLTFLQPGISQNKNMTAGGTFVGSWFSSNGAQVRSNSYLLDGAVMQNFLGGSASSIANTTLGIDGIREWRVVTNNFSAEYGLTMGSQMAIVTKSGTNSFHGSLFEYLRNSALDARNFFDRKTAVTPRRLPPFTRNNFGGSIGGPVKQDKLFFFGTYEGLRERLGATKVSNMFPAECHGAGGAAVWNGQGTRPAGSLGPCPQLGSNPSGPNTNSVTISPVTAPLLALLPNPNLPNNQLTFPFNQPTGENYGQGRMDWTISNSDTLFGRHTQDETTQVVPLGYPGFVTDRYSKNQYITVSESHVFSPNLLNTFRFSFSNTQLVLTSPTDIKGPELVTGRGVGLLSIAQAGIGEFGPRFSAPIAQNQKLYSWSDDLFLTRGAHSLKFGALINRYDRFSRLGAATIGRAIFPTIASFLLAQPSTYLARAPGSVLESTWRYNTLGFYLQDDWRVRPSFTLNLGLRYEFLTTPAEALGRGSSIRDLRVDATPTNGDPFENPSYRNFSPRVGFAWDVGGTGKMAVRGGAAILYDVATFGGGMLTLGWPYSSNTRVGGPAAAQGFSLPLVFPSGPGGRSAGQVDYHLQQPYSLQYNFSVERELPGSLAATVSYAGSRGINLYKRTEGNPTIPQGIPVNGVCVARPTGQAVDLNQPYCWRGGDPRVNPNWDTSGLLTAASNSFYNSLQVQLRKRLSHGLQFQSSYTYSKVIDETQGITDAENTTSHLYGTDPFHREVDRGLAAFDSTHNWAFNTIYRLPELSPSAGGLGKLLNGWWVSGILRLSSGYPFTPALGNNRSLSGVAGGGGGLDRPDLKPGRNGGNIVLGGADQYFDGNAFTVPAAGFLGNAGRNILRGPGLANLNLTIAKDTALGFLGESGRLEFRAEFFNLLNRVNLSTPEVGVADEANAAVVFAGARDGEAPLPSAGRILSTATTSRQIQFSLKLLF